MKNSLDNQCPAKYDCFAMTGSRSISHCPNYRSCRGGNNPTIRVIDIGAGNLAAILAYFVWWKIFGAEIPALISLLFVYPIQVVSMEISRSRRASTIRTPRERRFIRRALGMAALSFFLAPALYFLLPPLWFNASAVVVFFFSFFVFRASIARVDY